MDNRIVSEDLRRHMRGARCTNLRFISKHSFADDRYVVVVNVSTITLFGAKTDLHFFNQPTVC